MFKRFHLHRASAHANLPRLPITDNAVFCWGLQRNPEVCKELLETVLDIAIDGFKVVTTEHELMSRLKVKMVRLDVYCESEGRIFDIEM